MRHPIPTIAFALFAMAAFLGCGAHTATVPESKTTTQRSNNTGDNDTQATTTHSHDHSGWWCTEHGVPEEVCALCNSKIAAEFQKKGDWCKDHDRPDSQCFICHPELEEKFAAQYEAKFGKKPPKPEIN